MLNKKYLKVYLILLIFIFLFTAVSAYIIYHRQKTDTNAETDYSEDISQEIIEDLSSEQTVQAEIIYYDKSWYDSEIINYSDVILPYKNSNPNYFAETVFVGDSNTEGLALFEHIAYSNVVGKHSMPIQGVATDDYLLVNEDNPETEEDESQYITMLDVLAGKQPKRIIINFGTNNAGKGASADYFAYMYSNVLAQIKAVCPDTEIVVAAVLPVCLERDNLNLRQDVIDSFNIELAGICRENGIGFLNYSEVFKDSATGYGNPSYFSVDGIHLNRNGYGLLLDYVENHQYNINR